jgi:hypothetical protein
MGNTVAMVFAVAAAYTLDDRRGRGHRGCGSTCIA